MLELSEEQKKKMEEKLPQSFEEWKEKLAQLAVKGLLFTTMQRLGAPEELKVAQRELNISGNLLAEAMSLLVWAQRTFTDMEEAQKDKGNVA